MDWVYDIGHVVVMLDNLVWLPNFLAEATIVRALFLPDVGLGPPVDHLEPLHNENPQVFRLVVGAAMNSWDNAFHDLSKDIENIDLWHSQLNQNLEELY